MPTRRRRWVKCKGCGGTVVLFDDDYPPYYSKGAVGHSKPIEFTNIPGTVYCKLFSQLSTEQFFAFHADAESIDPPTEFKPAEN